MFKRKKTALQAQSIETVETAHEDKAILVDEQKELMDQLFEKTDSYIQTNISLLKLKTVDKTANLVSSLSAKLVLYLLCFLLMLMISAGAAFWVGHVLENIPLGFMIVAGFYALLIALYFMIGKKVIKKTVRESVISDLIK